MGEVLEFSGPTTADIEPCKVIEGAAKANLKSVVIIGYDQDDALYLATSEGYSPDILWSIEQAKAELMRQGE